jgi:UDPglucose 6-dehydrogenase
VDLAHPADGGAGVIPAAAPTAFLGLSHLGIISGIGWASFGQPVLAIDPDATLVERLARGDLPVREPGLPELLARSADHITFASNLARLAECPLVIVARDVPTDEGNASNLEPVLALIDQAVAHLRPGVVLVVMSQVPAGFTRKLGERIRAARPDLPFELYYWVETLIFGDAVRRCLEPERFMVGCADPAQPLPALFRAGLERYGCPILPMSYESAELTKTAINLYLVGSVTYANMFADLCEAIGADWSQMAPALRLDKRIGPAAYIRPSLGVAGGNLERDLITIQSLCRQNGVDCGYLDAMIDSNARRFEWVHRKLEVHVFSQHAEPNLAVWGLAYKKNTHSTKNSPALRLIEALQGRAAIRAWDPAVGQAAVGHNVSVVGSRDAVLAGSDALLIMADWDEFAVADLAAIRQEMRRPVIIDSVAVLDARRGEMDGIEYVAMGR